MSRGRPAFSAAFAWSAFLVGSRPVGAVVTDQAVTTSTPTDQAVTTATPTDQVATTSRASDS